MPGRGSLGGSPSNDDMSGGGVTFLPLGPILLCSAPLGLSDGGRGKLWSTGTRIPPTMTEWGKER